MREKLGFFDFLSLLVVWSIAGAISYVSLEKTVDWFLPVACLIAAFCFSKWIILQGNHPDSKECSMCCEHCCKNCTECNSSS